jgi:hypothetical protein
MCDYTFGDQSSVINNVYGGFMKEANILNQEFIDKYKSIKLSNKGYMTLFIDNIRLYNRDIKIIKESDRIYVNDLLIKNDLLSLCSKLPDMKFIIFTGFEDTPIDDFIFDKIPTNVLGVFAANAISFGGKVHPIPYGLKRKMVPNDINKNKIILDLINVEIQPSKLLYINHTISNNHSERNNLHKLFEKESWATVTLGGLDYKSYLTQMKDHKFMLSPNGNAVDCDCHRNWELFYMKRVPIVKRCKYLEFIFKDFPVLFVDDFSEVNEELLINNNHLYEDALNIDYKLLDLAILFDLYIKKMIKL